MVEAVEVFEMPSVPKGQVVINVEGKRREWEWEGEGEGERVAESRRFARRMSSMWDGGGTWRTCGVGVCVYRTNKGPSGVKRHQASIHDIDIVWHYCPYRAKRNSNLKRHRADVHDIGATWYDCLEPNCSHKAKQEGTIKQH